jgi:hypothetical protein
MCLSAIVAPSIAISAASSSSLRSAEQRLGPTSGDFHLLRHYGSDYLERDLRAFHADPLDYALPICLEILQERDRWFRGVGYPTRTLFFLVVLALLYWWLAPSVDLSSRPLGSLTLKEIGGLRLRPAATFGVC